MWKRRDQERSGVSACGQEHGSPHAAHMSVLLMFRDRGPSFVCFLINFFFIEDLLDGVLESDDDEDEDDEVS